MLWILLHSELNILKMKLKTFFLIYGFQNLGVSYYWPSFIYKSMLLIQAIFQIYLTFGGVQVAYSEQPYKCLVSDFWTGWFSKPEQLNTLGKIPAFLPGTKYAVQLWNFNPSMDQTRSSTQSHKEKSINKNFKEYLFGCKIIKKEIRDWQN